MVDVGTALSQALLANLAGLVLQGTTRCAIWHVGGCQVAKFGRLGGQNSGLALFTIPKGRQACSPTNFPANQHSTA